MDDQYIFNIPRNHISALLRTVYPDQAERNSLVNQECGEFLQAFSKYTLCRLGKRATLTELGKTRDKLIEEMTHVLVCFGMLAYEQNITQKEINAKVMEKKIDGVIYPFEIHSEKKHISIEDLLKGLEICQTNRALFQTDPEHNCSICAFKDSDNVTIACRPMIQEALYYLKKSYEANAAKKSS